MDLIAAVQQLDGVRKPPLNFGRPRAGGRPRFGKRAILEKRAQFAGTPDFKEGVGLVSGKGGKTVWHHKAGIIKSCKNIDYHETPRYECATRRRTRWGVVYHANYLIWFEVRGAWN